MAFEFFQVTDGSNNINIATEELILDNLINREEEPEDIILVNSGILQRLIAQTQQEPSLSLSDWERELDRL